MSKQIIMNYFKHTTDGFTYLTALNIDTAHAFSTRYGKPGNGKFSSESMSVLCNAINISKKSIIYNKQVRGSDVHVITPSNLKSHFPNPDTGVEADGLITQVKGIALMVFTADCVPILLYDPIQGAVGAVHAGWQGTSLNIAATTINKMKSAFGCSPDNICAAIGPCISKCCFETDADVAVVIREALCNAAEVKAAEICITRAGKKFMIDLKEANRVMSYYAGVRNISISDDCTVCTQNGRRYWSHRRDGKNRGCQAAVISM